MNIYKLRSIIHVFDQKIWFQSIQQLLQGQLKHNQSFDAIQQAYFKNIEQIDEVCIQNLLNVLLREEGDIQNRIKLSRLIHHFVLKNAIKIEKIEPLVINSQQLTIKKIMQQDNLKEILESIQFQVSMLNPLPKQIQRVYFEENIKIQNQ